MLPFLGSLLPNGTRALAEEALASNVVLAPGLEDFTMESEAPVKPDEKGNYPVALPGIHIQY